VTTAPAERVSSTTAGGCPREFRAFLRDYVYLDERSEDGDVSGVVRWQWWPSHDRMVEDIEHEQRLIVLKARQLGWSWILAANLVHRALLRPSFLGGVVSAGQLEAGEFLRKCRVIVRHLPPAWGVRLTVDSSTMVQLSTGGAIRAFPSTPDAGRGFTFSAFVADEAAFHAFGAQNYAAYAPATEHGQIIIVSSAGDQTRQVVNDWFQRTWIGGRDGRNRFTARFYSWRERPGRDDGWYKTMEAELSAMPGQLQREHPSTPEEAFAAMLRLIVRQDTMDWGRRLIREPLREVYGLPDGLSTPYLSVWAPPSPGIAYVGYTDGGGGRLRDPSASGIMEQKSGVYVATLRENVLEPRQHAALMLLLLQWYNMAFYGFERAEGGEDFAWVMSQARYPRMYWHQERPPTLRQKYGHGEPTQRLGMPVTAETRPPLIRGLVAALDGRRIWVPDATFWSECSTFVMGDDGKPRAASGKHDDMMLMGAGLVRMQTASGADQAGSLAPLSPALSTGWRW
jgi:hypothetical protein